MITDYQFQILDSDEQFMKFRLMFGGDPMSFKDVFAHWRSEDDFIRFYRQTVLQPSFKALYWEHPALSKAYLDKPYECILQKSRPLENLRANETAFSQHIYETGDVSDFLNLGNDARLIVPHKKSEEAIYNHLALFLKQAEESQIISLFQRIGHVAEAEIDQRQFVWLNTAGLGVIWLHIRLDSRPKYYKTVAYRQSDYLKSV